MSDIDKQLAKWDADMEKDYADDPGASIMFADRILGILRRKVAESERILLKTKQTATEQIQNLERELCAARAVVRTAKDNIPMSCHIKNGQYLEQLQCADCRHQGKCAIQKLDIALTAYKEAIK